MPCLVALLGGCHRSPAPDEAVGMGVPRETPTVVCDLDGTRVGQVTEDDLQPGSLLELKVGGAYSYRLRLDRRTRGLLHYYGLPAYPGAVGAVQLKPEEGESAPLESGYIASLVAVASRSDIERWYKASLGDWSVVQVESDVVLTQRPGGRRRVCVTELPGGKLTLIGYQVYPEDASPLVPLTGDAARKCEHVLLIVEALDAYKRDTGKPAQSLSDLTAHSGPTGYAGPYLPQPLTDPYSGNRYEIHDGKLTGPGDVVYFTS